jgi:hypothetical protein
MPERVLNLAEGPRASGHHPREGVTRLVQVNLADPLSLSKITSSLSFAKTSSAFSFNNLGKPDITC